MCIVGTRYYKFYGEDLEEESFFEQRVDALTGEIGDRGRARQSRLQEAVPPEPAPEPAPAPAPAPNLAAARALAPAPAPQPAQAPLAPAQNVMARAPAAGAGGDDDEFTPTMLQSPAPVQVVSAGLEELSALFKEIRHDAKAERDEMEAKMETRLAQARAEMETKAKADMDALREEMTPREQQPAISDGELITLQARLEALHAAELLAEAELFAVEDLVADFVELQATVPDGGVLSQEAIYSAVGGSCAPAVKLHKLVRLSNKMGSDAAFARQVKRKFVDE